MSKADKIFKILTWVSAILVGLGIIFIDVAHEETVYPTSEYWVAKDYHHVYYKNSGQIADLITSNESIKIDGDEIIVTETTMPWLETLGWILICVFGMVLISFIICYIGESEWWQRISGG